MRNKNGISGEEGKKSRVKWKRERERLFTLPFGALTLISIQYLSLNPTKKSSSLSAAFGKMSDSG
jgi:hypothetical protein